MIVGNIDLKAEELILSLEWFAAAAAAAAGKFQQLGAFHVGTMESI